jgi:hypothetical protein
MSNGIRLMRVWSQFHVGRSPGGRHMGLGLQPRSDICRRLLAVSLVDGALVFGLPGGGGVHRHHERMMPPVLPQRGDHIWWRDKALPGAKNLHDLACLGADPARWTDSLNRRSVYCDKYTVCGFGWARCKECCEGTIGRVPI